MGFAPTWLRHVSPPLLHKTTLTTARTIASGVTTTISIIFGFNKIQNGDVLVPANPGLPGKRPLKRTEKTLPETDVVVSDPLSTATIYCKTKTSMTNLYGNMHQNLSTSRQESDPDCDSGRPPHPTSIVCRLPTTGCGLYGNRRRGNRHRGNRQRRGCRGRHAAAAVYPSR